MIILIIIKTSATYLSSNASIKSEQDCRFSKGSQVLAVSGQPRLYFKEKNIQDPNQNKLGINKPPMNTMPKRIMLEKRNNKFMANKTRTIL